MNTIMMNMNGPGIEIEATMLEEYGVEVMFSGWNPQVAMVVEQLRMAIDQQVILPAEMANANVDAFLQRLYEFQC
jgi:anti-anti-sigma regulatory factor